MTQPLVISDTPVLLIGGGDTSHQAVRAAQAFATRVVAADGGAERCAALGLEPEAIIGDLDSLSDAAAWRNRGIAVHHIAEQDSTDFEKCVTHIEAPLILALGFTGARVDHTLAVMNSLARLGPRPLVVVGTDDVVWAMEAATRLGLPTGTTVSLFPMKALRGTRSVGLKWPIDGLEFAPMGFSGTSNESTGGYVEIELDREGMLGMLPLSALEAVCSRYL
jgi:thiamine pyrophosphokinase